MYEDDYFMVMVISLNVKAFKPLWFYREMNEVILITHSFIVSEVL